MAHKAHDPTGFPNLLYIISLSLFRVPISRSHKETKPSHRNTKMASQSSQTPVPSPEWANLPSVVVQQISDQIKSITDFVNFRAVCPSWRSSSLPKPQHLPPQIPWLMIPYNPHKDKNPDDNSIRLFYDLSQSKMHKIYLPETRHMMCCASSKGWLVLVAEEGTEVVLFNPLTRKKISLPNFTTLVDVFAFEKAKYDASAWFVPFIGNFVITKVVFSTDPTEPGCVIMVFLQKTCRIFFCRVGDPCWTLVNMDPEEIRTEKPSDGTFYNDKFYLMAHDGVLRVYDLNAPMKQLCCSFEPDFQSYSKYFLEGKSGVYLVVIHGRRAANEDPQEEEEDGESSDEDPQEEEDGESSDDDLQEEEEDGESSNEDQQGEEDQKENQENNPNDQEDQKDEQEDQEDEQENQEDDSTKKAVEIYQILDPEFHLKPVKRTTNLTIFRGDNHHYLALNSENWPSLKGDHLYLSAPCQPSDQRKKGKGGEMVPPCYGIFMASLEEGIGEKIVGDLGARPMLWPSAPEIWVQPSLV